MIVSMLAMCGPSFVLTYQVARAWDRFRAAPLRIAMERGLAPVTVGLILSSGYVLTRTTDHSLPAYLLTALALVVAMATRLHPLWVLALAAGVGATGIV